ncbi:MAG: cupin domain-containing protein [Candidatus Sulfotelmatobacter sp.]
MQPFAIVPLICATSELALPEYGGEANDTTLRTQAASDEVKTVTVNKVDCPNWPLQSLGAVTVYGDPSASGKTVFESKDRQITGGIWKCSPGTFDLTFTWDEMALVLEGELIIEESTKQKVRILPGDFFFVPRGARTRWTVVKPLKKLFFSRE